MTITYRNVKGSALTYSELDANFTDLDTRLGYIEGAFVVQARLNYTNTTTVSLVAHSGNRVPLWDGTRWVYRAIGTAPTLSNGGIGNLTVVNVYAYWTGTAIALEYSATAWTTDSDGMPFKTGDKTRLLVGKVLTNASGQFVDSIAHRGVVSYWNRKRASVAVSASAQTPTVSNTWENLGSVFVRCVSFANDSVQAFSSVVGYNSASAVAIYGGVGLDSQSSSNGQYTGNTAFAGNIICSGAGNYIGDVSEGAHFFAATSNVSTHTNTTLSVIFIHGTVWI